MQEFSENLQKTEVDLIEKIYSLFNNKIQLNEYETAPNLIQ